MGSLITAAGPKLLVDFPDEKKTGADMEWNFVDVRRNRYFGLILQAKRIYGDGGLWRRHNYRELYHEAGSSGQLQATVLCNTASRASPPTYPLYLFYHRGGTIHLASKDGTSGLLGVNVADGYAIESLVRTAQRNVGLRTRNRSLGTIAPVHFSLADLFCPMSIAPRPPQAFLGSSDEPFYFGVARGRRQIGSAMPPTPDLVRERLVAIRDALQLNLLTEAASIVAELPPVPEVSDNIPDHIRRLMNGTDGDEQVPGRSRWRLVFRSASPPDDEGYGRFELGP